MINIELKEGFNLGISDYKYKKMYSDFILFAEKIFICIDEK